MPPISIVSVPAIFMVMLELATRPFSLSNRISPLDSLLFKSAFRILKGTPLPALGPGGTYFKVEST